MSSFVFKVVLFSVRLLICVTILFCRLDDGTCRMYYTGQGSDGSTAIGVAKLSVVDGPAEWVREQAKLSFSTVE